MVNERLILCVHEVTVGKELIFHLKGGCDLSGFRTRKTK